MTFVHLMVDERESFMAQAAVITALFQRQHSHSTTGISITDKPILHGYGVAIMETYLFRRESPFVITDEG
jgi:hypothetical protein